MNDKNLINNILPPELQLIIFSKLTPEELRIATSTCLEWNRLMTDPSIWKNKCLLWLKQNTDLTEKEINLCLKTCTNYKLFYRILSSVNNNDFMQLLKLSRKNPSLALCLIGIPTIINKFNSIDCIIQLCKSNKSCGIAILSRPIIMSMLKLNFPDNTSLNHVFNPLKNKKYKSSFSKLIIYLAINNFDAADYLFRHTEYYIYLDIVAWRTITDKFLKEKDCTDTTGACLRERYASAIVSLINRSILYFIGFYHTIYFNKFCCSHPQIALAILRNEFFRMRLLIYNSLLIGLCATSIQAAEYILSDKELSDAFLANPFYIVNAAYYNFEVAKYLLSNKRSFNHLNQSDTKHLYQILEYYKKKDNNFEKVNVLLKTMADEHHVQKSFETLKRQQPEQVKYLVYNPAPENTRNV